VIFLVMVGLALKEAFEADDGGVRFRIVRGNFYDAHGVPITYYNDDGVRAYYRGYLFGALLGYDSVRFGRHGLEHTFDPYLTFAEEGYSHGADVRVTVNMCLQTALFEIMNDNLGEGMATGIILNAETGEILALVNTPSYDPGLIDGQFEELRNMPGMFMNAALIPVVPGSVAKLVTSAMITRLGLHEQVYYDTGSVVIDGARIANYGRATFGRITQAEALKYSVNTYYAANAVEIGGMRLERTFRDFKIGEEMNLDFGMMRSSFNFRDNEGILCDVSIAASAFGQGRTLVSPLHMAMITASIETGSLIKPYIVREITSPSAYIIREGRTEKIAEVLSEGERAAIKSGMRLAALHNRFDAKLDLYIKTGTAQTGRFHESGEEKLHNWITCIFNHEGTSYVITIAFLDDTVRRLRNIAESVINYIILKEE
jgi:peptidoglycan glycosyltransferase